MARISEAGQLRRVRMTKAQLAIGKAWDDHDLSTLEMIEVLAEMLHSITARHRAITEPDQPDPKVTEITL